MKNTDGMICALKSDLFKLKKHKSVWIGLAVMFVLILLAYCVYWIGGNFIDNIFNPEDENTILLKAEFAQLGTALLADFSGTCALSLFVAIITCLFIGNDFSNGAIRLSVSRGANRAQIYFSKWITLAVLVFAYSVLALIVCGIFTAFKSVPGAFTAHHFGLLMRCCALQLLCNISTMSMVLALAFLLRSSGASIGASVGIFIALSLVFGLIGSLQNLFSDNSFIMFMPLQQSTIAGSMTKYTATELCAVIIMPIVYGTIATLIGLFSFLKRDIK